MKSHLDLTTLCGLYESLFFHNPDASFAIDTDGKILLVNEAALELTGYKNNEILGTYFTTLLTTKNNCFQNAINGNRERFEATIYGKNRNTIDLSITVSPITSDLGTIGIVGIARDITTEKRTRKLLDGQNQILEMMTKGASFQVVLDTIVRFIEGVLNGGLCSILLMDQTTKTLKKGSSIHLQEEYLDYFSKGISVTPYSGSCGTAAYKKIPVIVKDISQDFLWDKHKEIAIKHNLHACWSYPVLDDHHQTLGTFAVYYHEPRTPNPIDMLVIEKATYLTSLAIQHYHSKEKINFMAYHDDLTELPNRRYFTTGVTKAIYHAQKNHNQHFALMFIDLDRFKVINDSLGHNIGDLLLKEVSTRLRNCIRSNDIVSRQGGDEFILLLEGLSKYSAEEIAYQILDELSRPFVIKEKEVFITPSIGISMYPDNGLTEPELIRKADIAMYQAKKNGRNTFRFYEESMESENANRLKIENELRKALDNKELHVVYQPIVDLTSTQVNSFEALLRWEHSTLGNVPPSQFIPIAEETGLIVSFGEWVLENACMQLKKWDESGFRSTTVSVNISIQQFYQPTFTEMFHNILKKTGISPDRLVIEVTESTTMDIDTASSILYELRKLGIKVSVDDFGTGYSSLSYLKTLPIDYLKIDRSFIKDIGTCQDDENIAKTIILMAHSMGMKVIAEGIETIEHLNFLQNHQCDKGQGYYFCRPLKANEISDIFKKNQHEWTQNHLIM